MASASGLVCRALKLVGIVGASFELGLDAERDLQCERGDRVEQELADRLVDAASGDRQAAAAGGLDRLVVALVVGDQSVAALAVADGHAFAAAPAHDQPLQQRGSLARGTGGAFGAVCLGVVGERAEVVLVLLEGDVSQVRVEDQRCPLLAREHVEADLALGGLARAAPAIDERAGIARVVQHLQHAPVIQRHPRQLAAALAGADPNRE